MNTLFKIMDSYLVLGKYAMEAAVLDIRNGAVILRLYWLTENGFLVDTQNGYLRNVNTD